MPASILDSYVTAAPSEQNAVDIFKGEWASRFPPPHAGLEAGGIPLFQDSRLAWALAELGGVRDCDVLELGPLEGGHSFMLEQAGAGSITAIEANTRAFLKCLITKELLGMRKARFRCGNFVPFLETNRERFDLALAAGVLYHMTDPVRVIALLSSCTDRVYFWTHYYDRDVINASDLLRPNFAGDTAAEHGGFQCRVYRQEYGAALGLKKFCGGSQPFSHWMRRDDLLRCLQYFGFSDLRVAHEQRDHPHGPCFSVLAQKQTRRA